MILPKFFRTRRVRLTTTILATALLAGRLFAGPPGTATLYTEPDADVAISLTPVANLWSGEGFMPVRVKIENRAERARTWTFSFNASSGYSTGGVQHEVTLSAEAAAVSEAVVFVPGGYEPGSGPSTVIIRASGPGTSISSGQNLLQAPGDRRIVTATTADLESTLFSATNRTKTISTPSSTAASAAFAASSGSFVRLPGPESDISVVAPTLWPADWRVWSPFERVVLTEEFFSRLDGARRAALLDWVSLGGTLDLYPRTANPGGQEEIRGLGLIRHRNESLATEANRQPEVALHGDRASSLLASRTVTISPDRLKELRPETGTLGLSFFLLGFAILVGPVNLFVFAPSRRRHRLFFTVPLISLAASALMGIYIVVMDGFGGQGSQRGLVLLLPATNQAILVQQQAARTGVLLGAAFTLPEDVALTQTSGASFIRKSIAYGGRGNDEPARHYSRSATAVSGDWFASRRLQVQALKRLVPTRARVERVDAGEPGAAPVVQSTVGTVLRELLYRDPQGQIWAAAEVPPGVRVTLTPTPMEPLPSTPPTADPDTPVAPIIPFGHFTAVGGAAEGIGPIATLDSIRWDEPKFLYTGPLSEARTP